jgi:phosphoribosylanthranilate isomerase
MRPKLKICGITNLEDARYCAAAGADCLGFILHPQSPRNVEPAAVREMSEWLFGVDTVGVFVDVSADVVNEVALGCGFAFVQLHGDESPEYCARIDVPLIKAFRVADSTQPSALWSAAASYEGVADYFLFDTYSTEAHGGTGRTFDWSILGDYPLGTPFFLSGGISAGNVTEAVTIARPFAIDVSSSIEVSPGKKDFDRLAAFLEAFDGLSI